MTPEAIIAKWMAATTTERAAAQEHFLDLCRLLGEPTPNEADPQSARINGVAAGILRAHTDNIAGTGLRLAAKPDYRAPSRVGDE